MARPPFLGPPSLAGGWEAFVARYSEKGWLGVNSENAALLNRLAFEPNSVHAFLSLRDSDPRGYRRIRNGIEDAARALSRDSRGDDIRPLHKAIVAALITQWTDLKRRHGLFPPQERAKSNGVSVATANDIRTRYNALLRSPEGSLLAGTLLLAEDNMIGVETARVTNRLASRVRDDDVRPLAHDLAVQALYKFDPTRGGDFTSFLVGGLKHFLAGQALFTLLGTRRFTHERQLAEESAETLVDENTSGLVDNIARADAGRHLRRLVSRLPEKEREVLLLRFGLADDGVCHSLVDISQRFGCSKQNIQRLQRQGLERCRSWCQALSDEAIGGDLPPTTPGRSR